jgi:CheY-like chemotaxis protein
MISVAPSGGERPKVLVVDDEEDILAYLVTALEDHGFWAEGAADAPAALEAAHSQRPDLILLDIMMPGQSGLSLYRQMRRDPATAGVPVFILSGYSRAEELAAIGGQLQAEGLPPPDGYLEKPIPVPALLQRLRAILARRGAGGFHA